MNFFLKKSSYFLVLLLAGIIIVSFWLFRSHRTATHTVKNVILISIDTCRADYLSCYGYKRKTTPCIDRIAEEGVIFTNVIAPAPLTLPAHSSMMTGTIPPFHGVHTNLNSRLGDSNITLAEILKQNGFTTGAVISSFILDSQFGLNQGFDTYSDRFKDNITFNGFNERRGEETSSVALEWLDKHKKDRFFLFIHYYDPHDDYNPPEPFASRFKDDLYAGEIAYTDLCISRVVEKLQELGLYDSSLLIITGDHGEMLGEHDEAEHSYYIYQGAVKVPLIFRFPGEKSKPVSVTNIAGLVDIMPTICSMLNIEPPAGISGRDLTPYFNNSNIADRENYLYCESMTPLQYSANPLQGVITDQWKYIKTTRPELYNLVKDPAESDNLLEKEPKRGALLKKHLEAIIEEHQREDISDNKIMLDQEAMNRLASLGYVGDSSLEDNYEFDPDRTDPKDLIHYHGLHKQVHALVLEKKFEQAKAICKKMIEKKPDIHMGYTQTGKIAVLQNDPEAAIAHFTKAVHLAPERYEVYSNLGNAYKSNASYAEAVKQYQIALELGSNNAEVHINLGHTLENLDKIDDAIHHYQEALRINPAFAPDAHNRLGEVYLEKGNIADSIKHFTESLKIRPDSAQVHNNIGMAFGRQKKFAEAADHFFQAVEIDPNLAEAGYNLGLAFEKLDRLFEAIDQYKKTIELNPDYLDTHMRLASIYSMHPKAEYRNGTEALRLATFLCEKTGYQNPHILDTLGSAYAETGQFAKARETAVKALKMADASGNYKLSAYIKNKLSLYRHDMPYRAKR